MVFCVGTLWQVQGQDAKAKPEKPKFDKSKLFFGGGFGASFSNAYSYVECSPLVGYRITPKIAVGAGPEYIWQRTFDYSTHIYGGRTFARYYLIPMIFAHAEVETISVKFSNERSLITRIPVGAGASMALGGNAFINGMLLYDLCYKNNGGIMGNSPIIFRLGINMGFW